MSVMSLVMLVNLLSVSVVGSTPYFAIPPRAHLAFPHLLSAPTPGLSASVLLVPLNHTDAAPTEHISLRYWVDDSCFKPGGPLLAHLGGEGEQGPVGCSQQARDLKALVLSIEHRFYGKSWLTNRSLSESLSLEYLQHLNVRNALTDSKMVIEHVLARYESSNKVVSLGGSYSGSLSAFLRMEYPETVLGSVSESGVVSAVLDFPGFDEAILSAASISAQHSRGGDPCGERLQNATYAMERIAAGENGPSQLLAIFNGSTLKDLNDFWYAVADGPAMLIQYGSKSVLCDALEAAPWDGSDQAIAAYLAQIISHKYGDFFVAGCFYDSSCWGSAQKSAAASSSPVSYTHLRAHETPEHLVCRLLLEKKKKKNIKLKTSNNKHNFQHMI
eukprot:TRINITY_DN60283_c0_g1_i2.p1 TRINITY_DN60283_c0_g1~~TRINITY_DN60283_c0_g1_i2.p1  ORF type:complete len:387 (-),score=88.50 TRINITY_DN60283_c0_g1_i2:65-1225(-)